MVQRAAGGVTLNGGEVFRSIGYGGEEKPLNI